MKYQSYTPLSDLTSRVDSKLQQRTHCWRSKLNKNQYVAAFDKIQMEICLQKTVEIILFDFPILLLGCMNSSVYKQLNTL